MGPIALAGLTPAPLTGPLMTMAAASAEPMAILWRRARAEAGSGRGQLAVASMAMRMRSTTSFG
jgi:hypothetical protein